MSLECFEHPVVHLLTFNDHSGDVRRLPQDVRLIRVAHVRTNSFCDPCSSPWSPHWRFLSFRSEISPFVYWKKKWEVTAAVPWLCFQLHTLQ